MGWRSARQLGLAAVPVMLLAQCAPQCAPAGTLTPLYNTVAPIGPSTFNASADGRYVAVGTEGGMVRIDVDSGQQIPTTVRGVLSPDGSTIVGERNGQLVRDDLAAPGDEVLPALPRGWSLVDLSSVSNGGQRVLVSASSAGLGRGAVLELDGAGWREVLPVLPGGATPRTTFHGLVSADGGTVVLNAENGLSASAYAVTAAGPELLSPTSPGGASMNWTGHHVRDLSPDGRYVLLWSTTLDGSGRRGLHGRLDVLDRATGTTTPLPVETSQTSADVETISADGQRIGFVVDSPLGSVTAAVAAVYDRGTGVTTTLTPTGTIADAAWVGPVDISANGRRVVWSRVGELARIDFV
jgi:hypothetical protein